MKNLDHIVIGLVDALFEDIAFTDLCTAVCLIKSRDIISRAHKSRGLPFFTITLPSCSKLLESSLENGWIGCERTPYHGAISNDDLRPRFLHSLWARIFTRSGQLEAEPDSHSIFLLRQVYNLFKKLDMECEQEYVDAEIASFRRIESELPRSHPETWDSENPRWSTLEGHPLWGVAIPKSTHQYSLGLEPTEEASLYPWEHFRRMCAFMSSQLGDIDFWAIRPKHGPGAVSDGGKVRKYEFHTWPRKLQAIFPADWFTSHDFTDRTVSDHEPPSRMCAVPKTQKGPRLIATEPSAHQWIQGGLQRWFEDRIKSSFLGLSIDFRSQEYSRVLALEASISKSFATVDLSAASDRISTRLVQYVFQGNHALLDALHACRTRSMVIPKGITASFTKDELILLRKFSTMGSACTFPVQTIVFTMIAHFALAMAEQDWDCTADGFRRRASSIRVFGDDIIIDTHAVGHLYRILKECGLKVNESKSFYKGSFRESCGMDAFDGVDVTPGYIRSIYNASNPESLDSVVKCSNNLYKKGLWRTADRLLKTVPQKELKALPVARKDVGPVTLFTFVDQPLTAPKRWREDYQRWEYRYLTVTGKTRYSGYTGEASVFQFFMEDPDPMLPWQSGQPEQTRHRKIVAWVYPYQVGGSHD